MGELRGVSAQFTLKSLDAQVVWPKRRLDTVGFDRYKGQLVDLFATLTEPPAIGERAEQVLVCAARDENAQLFVTGAELRFRYDDVVDPAKAQEKLVECVRRLPLPAKGIFDLVLHIEGHLLFPDVKDALHMLAVGRLGIRKEDAGKLPGRVALCGVYLLLCERPVHTTLRIIPGFGRRDAVGVYIGRRGLSFQTVARLRRILASTLALPLSSVADLIRGSWLRKERA